MTSLPETRPFGNSPATCGYSRVLELISDKWTALIMYTLEDGSVRYGEMGRRIDGISKKMLTQTVRKLERDGLVQRHVTPTVPPTVDYSLTPLGETLLQPMKELRQWARVNYSHVEAARADYDLAYDGNSQSPAD
ncbi:winged helix-turn-helix transcriptional regulator [Paenibacillus tyrfis]|uniref:winged helix-turn-helix transcriptional regulator n=1 Tax=Paenibacillus tyrfis TaxID=1501230 RepID=UPI000B58A4A0|nr:helix-turn-helix domain-containing protein [Paenibacillus tyrfis]